MVLKKCYAVADTMREVIDLVLRARSRTDESEVAYCLRGTMDDLRHLKAKHRTDRVGFF